MPQTFPEAASSNHQADTVRPQPQPQPPSSKHIVPPPSKPHHSFPIDTKYPESALRTPLYALPFPHPKWGVDPRTGEAYEDTGLMIEALREDPGDVRESIEDVEEMSRAKRRKASQDESEEGEKGRVSSAQQAAFQRTEHKGI
ncbi:hypothetical protein yc1106_09199 [Curvularia clavata]|uniref:Uncharacterized protein n=1 Tax=Curvularia clavata TaxID=95742 RepID=A0A9Q9DXG6_CURCL|nr:hypothetical protein yc1106_09199 [Curvularia clavata]